MIYAISVYRFWGGTYFYAKKEGIVITSMLLSQSSTFIFALL